VSPEVRATWGLRPPIRSLGEASSFTVQMRSFQGHVYTGPAGVRVSVCKGSLPQGATPASPPETFPALLLPPPHLLVPRGPARGSSPTPAPPPYCGAAAATTTPLPRPAAGAGRSRARRPPLHAVPPGLRGSVRPRAGTLPTRAPLPGPPAPRTPKPQVAAGRSRRRAPRRGPRPPLGPAGGLQGPPRRAEPAGPGEGRGGRGARVVPGCHFLPWPRRSPAARAPSPSSPLPPPDSRSRPHSAAHGRRPRPGPRAGAEPGRRRRRGPAAARVGRRAGRRRPPAALYGLELEPGPGGGAEGRPRRRRRAEEERRASGGDINKPSARAVRALSTARRVAGSEPRSPPPCCALPPARPLSSRAAGRAGYRVARRVGRPGSPCCRGAASRLVLCSRRRPRRLPARPLPAALPPSVAVALPLSASSAGSPPPASSLRLPPSLPPAARRPGLRPPLAPRGRAGSGPGAAEPPGRQPRGPRGAAAGAIRAADGPSAPGGRSGFGTPPRPDCGAPGRAPCRSCDLGRPVPLGWSPGRNLPTLRRPSTWRGFCAGSPHPALVVGTAAPPLPGRCQVPAPPRPPPSPPAEPPAAFALQFSRPPPEPTALCAPQHWGWGQQRLLSRVATHSQVPRWPDGCTGPRSERLAPRGHPRASSTATEWAP
jgi:hypothetical protein